MLNIPYEMLSKVYLPEELIGIMKRLVLVMAMRLHTLIYSSIAATPMIGLIYDPKVKGYLEYIGQSAAGNVENIKSKNINEISDSIMGNYDDEKKKLRTRMAELEGLTKENVRLAFELMERHIDTRN